MNRHDQLLRDSAAAVLEVAMRRGGLPALEIALARFTERQRQLLPPDFLDTLRREANPQRVALLTPKEN